ncbi:MAG TPA: hypothetical protein VGM29_19275 [Polyangiaceae bacterium]
METRSVVRFVFAVVCLGATALGLNNTYGNNDDVRKLAEQTACGAPGCSVKILHESRSALSQQFGFQTELVQRGKPTRDASVDVECQRPQILLGSYECRVTSGGLPTP